MKSLLISILGVALAASGLAFAADAPKCDMKRVAKVHYCEKEQRVLTKNEVGTGKPVHTCAKCGKTAKAAGDCAKCEEPLAESSHPKGACTQCGETAVKADACLKEVFKCPGCASVHQVKGSCEACSVKLVKTPHYALLRYVCTGCGEGKLAAGKCTDATCPEKGKKLIRTCTQAGNAPHVSAKKPKKEKKPKKAKKKKKSKD